ncbi:MAG: peptidoglycan-associated lipoprotein Pal [Desulfomicrobium sp.]|nr:peptidoglycan-associated lipoprotein Pal [Desulfomicrobium sp.]MDP3429806.1 peptidoglycan-associated lipoprotein Pal [Desulfomicrobium sp.]
MKKLSVLVLIVLAFSLAMAGGCSKKVSSTPAGTSAAGTGDGTGGLTPEQLEAQRLAELQRQAIDKIGADRIYFAFDKSDLSDQSRQILAEKAELLKAHPALTLLIEGHCDERGTNEYNMALGERRARAAYEYLVLLGIEAGRLTIISYGEEYPAVPGSNEEAWAKNRRDEFKASVN